MVKVNVWLAAASWPTAEASAVGVEAASKKRGAASNMVPTAASKVFESELEPHAAASEKQAIAIRMSATITAGGDDALDHGRPAGGARGRAPGARVPAVR